MECYNAGGSRTISWRFSMWNDELLITCLALDSNVQLIAMDALYRGAMLVEVRVGITTLSI